jgi:hypothetical protein
MPFRAHPHRADKPFAIARFQPRLQDACGDGENCRVPDL